MNTNQNLIKQNICLNCNNSLPIEKTNYKFCSLSCSVSYNNKTRTKKTYIQKKCLNCNDNIPLEKKRNSFCSRSCSVSYNNMKRSKVDCNLEKNCLYCGLSIPKEKSKNTFCSRSCKASYSNQKRANKDVVFVKKPNKFCIQCNKLLENYCKVYCSRICDNQHLYEQTIKKWKNGEISGSNNNGCVIPAVKRFLREKYNNQCSECGWNKVNPFTNKVPLVADHIDGNYLNNTEENLRLICCNCDSLTATYCALNYGKGRKMR